MHSASACSTHKSRLSFQNDPSSKHLRTNAILTEKSLLLHEHERELQALAQDGLTLKAENTALKTQLSEHTHRLQETETREKASAKALVSVRKESNHVQQEQLSMAERHRVEVKALQDEVLELTAQIEALRNSGGTSKKVSVCVCAW